MPKNKLLLLVSVPFLALIIGLVIYNSFLSSKINKNLNITVEPGASKTEILTQIQKNLDLSNFHVFLSKIYLFLNKKVQFDAGNYSFTPETSYKNLFSSIRGGTNQTKITFLEGWRVEENALHLMEKVNTDYGVEYRRLALEKIGYLFPETYFIDTNTTIESLIELQTQTFNSRTEELFSAYSGELSKEEAVIISSIVEREVRSETDRPIVAGILIKRYLEGMPLDADATTQYAMSNRISCFGLNCKTDYWPKEITVEALQSDDPYNTRGKLGLPPTPICNPSLSSIRAVLSPTETQYYYYLTDNEGVTHYAITLDEHIANISKFL